MRTEGKRHFSEVARKHNAVKMLTEMSHSYFFSLSVGRIVTILKSKN